MSFQSVTEDTYNNAENDTSGVAAALGHLSGLTYTVNVTAERIYLLIIGTSDFTYNYSVIDISTYLLLPYRNE